MLGDPVGRDSLPTPPPVQHSNLPFIRTTFIFQLTILFLHRNHSDTNLEIRLQLIPTHPSFSFNQANRTFVLMRKNMMETKAAMQETVKLHRESVQGARSIEAEIEVRMQLL